MKCINIYYRDLSTLTSDIQSNNIKNSSSLLVQVFTGQNNVLYIQNILNDLTSLLPDAVIIGSTTDGEIMNGEVSTHQTVLSFTQFISTTLKAGYIEESDGVTAGQYLAKELIEEDTKLLITFSDGLTMNGEELLNGIHSVNKNVIVAGGMAGDNATFKQTYIFTKEKILSVGAVAVSLTHANLIVYNDYSFNWKEIGRELTITKVVDNRVYTIDNRTALETYKYYLGEEIEAKLPSIGIEFPLMIMKENMKIARAALSVHSDESLSFGGNFCVGDKVSFAHGDPVAMSNKVDTFIHAVNSNPAEAIFVYSCMARRRFMPSDIQNEILPLNNIAPTSGFFTYGEFYTSEEKKELLNQTMTVVSLSETGKNNNNIRFSKEEKSSNTSINALVHLLDITNKEILEQKALENTNAIFEQLFQQSPNGVLLVEDNQFLKANQKLLNMFGLLDEKTLLSKNIFDFIPNKQTDGSFTFLKLRHMQKMALNGDNQQFECLLHTLQGEALWAEVILTYTVIANKKVLYIICRDITGRRQMQQMLTEQQQLLYRQANYDNLTGLANRTHFMNEIENMLADNHADIHGFTLFFLDLDNFKQINDSLGHKVGDNVIKAIAKRLESSVSSNDLVARLGGDEFLILVPHDNHQQDIIDKVNTILTNIVKKLTVSHYTLYISASIGISQYPKDAITAENLLGYADTAMYTAKESGGNTYQFYESSMTASAYTNLIMERDLRKGMDLGEFEIYYQPQVDMHTKKMIGMEALIRWNHPVSGRLTPDKFIALAEKTGLIEELDLWVMRSAMQQFVCWYTQGLNPGKLALNMSMRGLESTMVLANITQSMEACHFQSRWLEIEMTETVLMKNPKQLIGVLHQMHDLGIGIAIDDFGTGYSSLAYLKQLPINKLKIDKSFIDDIPKDEDASMIVNTIIALAKNLNMHVLAEGIETKEQRDYLIDLGCQTAQGYLYSKPLSKRKMEKLLQAKDPFLF